MRVVVNMSQCESNGLCQGVAPDVFELDDDDNLIVLDETPDESARGGPDLPEAGHLDRGAVTPA